VSLTASLIAAGFLFVLLLIVRRYEKDSAKIKTAKPKRPVKRAAGTRNPANEPSEFHAVTINCNDSACDAAKALLGKRFLSDEAPRLPLDECTAPICDCRFKHHADRRNPKNRRNQFSAGIGGDTGIHKQDERTRNKDRRSDRDDNLY
jgi:hypothetical protein